MPISIAHVVINTSKYPPPLLNVAKFELKLAQLFLQKGEFLNFHVIAGSPDDMTL